jgi:hypothetical protein
MALEMSIEFVLAMGETFEESEEVVYQIWQSLIFITIVISQPKLILVLVESLEFDSIQSRYLSTLV